MSNKLAKDDTLQAVATANQAIAKDASLQALTTAVTSLKTDLVAAINNGGGSSGSGGGGTNTINTSVLKDSTLQNPTITAEQVFCSGTGLTINGTEAVVTGNIFEGLNINTDIPSGNAAWVRNGIYRGKCIGSTPTAAQYAAIRDGTFTDMFIGDYWEKEITYQKPSGGNITATLKMYIAGFNYRKGSYQYVPDLDTVHLECIMPNHIIVVPDKNLFAGKMMDGSAEYNSALLGYTGSYCYKIVIPFAEEAFNKFFGSSYMLRWYTAFPSYIENNATANSSYALARRIQHTTSKTEHPKMNTVDLLSERMIFGSPHIGGRYVEQALNEQQLPLFRLNPMKVCLENCVNFTGRGYPGSSDEGEPDNISTYWLRDVVNSTGFAIVDSNWNMLSIPYNANGGYLAGIRPYGTVYGGEAA